MSHHHHDHDHHHHHGHEHSETTGELSFEEKIVKLMDHWLQHNSDHAKSYRDWAEKAKVNEMGEISALLEEVADMTLAINTKFEQAAALVKKMG